MKPHVLVIEDNHHVAESLIDILEDTYEVTIKMTGADGLAEALSSHPELIILDIRLPDLDGYTIYERLQADAWGRDAKILVLTASESLENIAKNINLPTEYVLFKPEISVPELRAKVASRINS